MRRRHFANLGELISEESPAGALERALNNVFDCLSWQADVETLTIPDEHRATAARRGPLGGIVHRRRGAKGQRALRRVGA
ncbi:MAG: hypothetical protein IT384_15395 [Deltaproteobacteria bacterium]|nr:hypothetical protein [Deltaproteobacteria bacterium]